MHCLRHQQPLAVQKYEKRLSRFPLQLGEIQQTPYLCFQEKPMLQPREGCYCLITVLNQMIKGK